MALNPDDPRPPFRQIAADLRDAIERGEQPPGSQLPSTSELAARYKVAHMTVRNALRLLNEEGLVVARQGSGVFVRTTVVPDDQLADTDDDRVGELAAQIEAITGQMRTLNDRVADLESLIRQKLPPRG